MAAKLGWYRGWVRLGRLALGRYAKDVDRWRYRISTPKRWTGSLAASEMSDPYERRQDCAADLESEVRRLLKEAGCEVAP